MRLIGIAAVVGVLSCPLAAVAAVELSVEAQIAQAVSPLPESLRAGAAVVTYDSSGTPKVLRQGTNAIVCQPPQPAPAAQAAGTSGGSQTAAPPEFSVSCYHKSMQPTRDFQAKLRAEGKTAKELTDAVAAARKDTKLAAPAFGTMLYTRSGKSETEARTLWVLLAPNATAESTGLPTERPKEGGPWLMAAGTPGAHVMIPQAPAPAPTR